MERGESILDAIFDEDNLEDVQDVEMMDIEEGELVEQDSQTESRQTIGGDVNAINQEPRVKNHKPKSKKKKNKKKKGNSGPNVTDINRFVLDVCKHLRERKTYLVYNAVGCLGVSALSDLVKESVVTASLDLVSYSVSWLKVALCMFQKPFHCFQSLWISKLIYLSLLNYFVVSYWYRLMSIGLASFAVDAIQACGGQKTADGKRFRYGGGILWSVLKARDPNAYREIMKKGREFEAFKMLCLVQVCFAVFMPNRGYYCFTQLDASCCLMQFASCGTKQFRQQNICQGQVQNKKDASERMDNACLDQMTASTSDGSQLVEPHVQNQLEQSDAERKRASVHDRMRVPVTYDDLIGEEDPNDKST
ncbi:hypothetical protein TEA_001740 [Camellia sinensis var. sinensis]|uniref:Phosphorylated adapter RNA export protein n=1 Tax=Camellia sinensis var. sinensis TaxID=542762 RepID=A0A4S4E786_CAMSN|nr:hypothetical protein TEA_001740 [Camellia sinensis var. sinensis]